jgi:hypothetical protein
MKILASLSAAKSWFSSIVNVLTALKKFLFALTYLVTPWSRVLLEKLTGFAVSQEIPRI